MKRGTSFQFKQILGANNIIKRFHGFILSEPIRLTVWKTVSYITTGLFKVLGSSHIPSSTERGKRENIYGTNNGNITNQQGKQE